MKKIETLRSLGIDYYELKNAVWDFKKRGWASGDDKQIKKLDDGSNIISLKNRGLLYIDTWRGKNEKIIGQEIVVHNLTNIPVWGMSYFGGVTREVVRKSCGEFFIEELLGEGINSVLQLALSEVPREWPFRGPKTNQGFFSRGEKYGLFKYHNHILKPDFGDFHGNEKIAKRGVSLWQINYIGGLLIPREI